MPQQLFKVSLGRRGTALMWLERLLLAVGLICLGAVAFAWLDARWFAFRQGRVLDRALRERAAATAAGGGAAPRTAPGAGAPRSGPGAGREASETDRLDTFRPGSAAERPTLALPEGSLIGRIAIPRVGISALLLEGTEGTTLRRGVGHISDTPLPQRAGNVGLAGHRDTAFRGLKDIRKGDLIQLDTLEGTYRYGVDWAQVVDPSDVGVLATGTRRELTLVTCYPFYYVGSAPERFVVRAHQLEGVGTVESVAAEPR
jgi:sortase A